MCQAPNVFKKCVSGVAPPKHQMRLYVCHQMRLYVCHQMRLYVCHQMRLYVCHQMRLYVCHQMRLYVCHQMCLLNPQRSSLRSLTFARFARTFFDSPNKNSCLKSILVQIPILGPPNGPEMDPKWTQNGPKMDPKKWTQNGPKMDPKWTQNGPKMDPKWTHTVTHI